jgi:hypothetical protein
MADQPDEATARWVYLLLATPARAFLFALGAMVKKPTYKFAGAARKVVPLIHPKIVSAK